MGVNFRYLAHIRVSIPGNHTHQELIGACMHGTSLKFHIKPLLVPLYGSIAARGIRLS